MLRNDTRMDWIINLHRNTIDNFQLLSWLFAKQVRLLHYNNKIGKIQLEIRKQGQVSSKKIGGIKWEFFMFFLATTLLRKSAQVLYQLQLTANIQNYILLMHSTFQIGENSINPHKLNKIRDKPQESEEDQDTRTKILPMKVSTLDDEATQDRLIQKPKKKVVNTQQSSLTEKINIKLQKSNKIQKILAGPSLREKYADLLPEQTRYPISFEHQQLVKKLQYVDKTLQFLGSNRSMKNAFFSYLRKTLDESFRMTIKIGHIQQILFLCENFYNIYWAKNQSNNNKYQIMISLPENKKSQRLETLRSKIVEYLKIKEKELLQSKKLKKSPTNLLWHEEFIYEYVNIPMKTLPPNPESNCAQVRTLPDKQISSIKNTVLQRIFKQKKQDSEVKSLSSVDVANMIFNKTPGKKITDLIMSSIKQKQEDRKKNQQKYKLQLEIEKKIDKDTYLSVCDEIQLIYISKSVSNIFKIVLLQLLRKKLSIEDTIIERVLEELIADRKLGYLKEVRTSKGQVIIQIDKSKLSQVRQKYMSLDF